MAIVDHIFGDEYLAMQHQLLLFVSLLDLV